MKFKRIEGKPEIWIDDNDGYFHATIPITYIIHVEKQDIIREELIREQTKKCDYIKTRSYFIYNSNEKHIDGLWYCEEKQLSNSINEPKLMSMGLIEQ